MDEGLAVHPVATGIGQNRQPAPPLLNDYMVCHGHDDIVAADSDGAAKSRTIAGNEDPEPCQVSHANRRSMTTGK